MFETEGSAILKPLVSAHSNSVLNWQVQTTLLDRIKMQLKPLTSAASKPESNLIIAVRYPTFPNAVF
jgi:hypothetical protein